MYQKLGIQMVGERFARDNSLHSNGRLVDVYSNNSEMRMLVGNENNHNSICFLYVYLLL